MDAHKATITSIFDDTALIEIPFFQRSYVWKEDLWERFLEDMEFTVRTKTYHFFGTLIFKEENLPDQNVPYSSRLLLIDGQQRLTTFLIFLKVLCLKLNQYLTFDSQYRFSETGELILRHGKNDRDAFEKVMSVTAPTPIEGEWSSSRIVQAYNYFVEHLDPGKLNYSVIVGKTRFVRIDLDRSDDEQQIFDSLNSLGVSLTISELLKNYFFSQDNITEYQNTWESVFEKDAAAKAYWETTIETGRDHRPLIDIFFDAYFQLFIQDKTYNISIEDKLVYARADHLSNSYQHFINNYCGGDKHVVLNQLKDAALLFQKTFHPADCNAAIPSTFGIERLNVIIFGLKNTTLIPYVLYLARSISNDTVLNELYGILESYVMRRIVTRIPTTNYSKLFLSLIANEIRTPKDLRDRLHATSGTNSYVPTDTELQTGFTSFKLLNLYSKGVLYLLESYLHPEASATALLGFNGYSLEHLMPKKWRNNWPACTTDAEADLRDAKLLTLGNLAIITQSLNASIRDSNWPTKKAGKSTAKPGLDQCASGLITLQDALKHTDWTEADIDARAAWLYDNAKVLWKL